jgi:L-cystine transport system permease protein
MIDFGVLLSDFRPILGAVPRTLWLAITIFVLSIVVGLVMSLIQQARIPVLAQIVWLMKAFLRGTPMIVFIYLTYFGLPIGLSYVVDWIGVDYNPHGMSPNILIIVALTLTLAPFQSEIITGSFRSIDQGQIDAASSLGYTFGQRLWRVQIPQAVEEALPDLTNSFMVILKALSLAFLISVVDIFAQAQLTAALTYRYLEAFIVAGLLYWALAYIIQTLSDLLEKRFEKRGARYRFTGSKNKLKLFGRNQGSSPVPVEAA